MLNEGRNSSFWFLAHGFGSRCFVAIFRQTKLRSAERNHENERFHDENFADAPLRMFREINLRAKDIIDNFRSRNESSALDRILGGIARTNQFYI